MRTAGLARLSIASLARLSIASLALLLLLASPAAAATAIDVYTMGAGDDLFSAFGHAAICVRDDAARDSRCYNYGTADFGSPVPLTWNLLRGHASFWLSVADLRFMLPYYVESGRAVWRQTLPLDDAAATRIARALALNADERNRYYRYHHFDDNCTTRIRDLVDRETGGALSRDRMLGGPTFRQFARDGFAGSMALQAIVELLLGRSADRHTDSWSAMFLPSELRRQLTARLRAPPELVVPGRPRPPTPPRATWLGRAAFPIAGALLALLVVVARKRRRLALGVVAGVLGLLGVVLWSLAALSTFPELTRNELLFVFVPTDLALPLLYRLGRARWLARYANARVAGLGLVVLLRLLGIFVQPLWPLLLALLPLVAIGTAWRRE